MQPPLLRQDRTTVEALGWIQASSAPMSTSGLRGDGAMLAGFERRRTRGELALCGDNRRPCVRIDPKGGTSTQRGDTDRMRQAR